MNSRKPRTDSPLKTLPEERQGEIVEYMKAHSLPETVAWLRQDGLKTSRTALSDFWSWWHLSEQFRQDEVTTQSLLEQLKAEVPAMSEEQLDELGQRTFSLLSIRNQNLGGFVKVRSARSKAVLESEKLKLRERAEERMTRALGLQQQKFQRETCSLFVKWFEDKRAREVVSGSGSNTDKIERLGELMFGEDWGGKAQS